MNFDIKWWCLLALCCCGWKGAAGEGWRWPEGVESLRIDTKVRFVEGDSTRAQKTLDSNIDISNKGEVSSDEIPFQPASDTSGFYNRAGNDGRFPVRVVVSERNNYRVDDRGVYPVNNNNQSESLQFCKCVSNPDCAPRQDSAAICGYGKYLCCYKRPNQQSERQNSEFFNEIDDERPMLFPGKENIGGPFPPPPGSSFSGVFGPGHAHSVVLGAVEPEGSRGASRPVLAGPGGPTGIIGPGRGDSRPVLSGPGGPTGVIGPAPDTVHNAHASASAQQGVLVGPGGRPTGIIGPYSRPVLVGPGGPTGVIGPNRGGSRGILVGPGGPTGIVGPGGGYSRQQGPGLLVGPGGPTGIIGPGRQLLVGPGGPTGIIGPNRYFEPPPVIVKSQPWPRSTQLNMSSTEKDNSLSENEVTTLQTTNTETTTVLPKPRMRRATGSCSRAGCDGQDLLKVHRRKKMPNPNRRKMPFQYKDTRPIPKPNKKPPKYPPPDNNKPVPNSKKISVAKNKKLKVQSIHKLSHGQANNAAVRKAMAMRDRAVGEVDLDGRRQFGTHKRILTSKQKIIKTTKPKITGIGKLKPKHTTTENNPAAEKIPESPDYRYYPTDGEIPDTKKEIIRDEIPEFGQQILDFGKSRRLGDTRSSKQRANEEFEIVTKVEYIGEGDEFEVEDFAQTIPTTTSTTTEKVTVKPSVFRSLPVFFGVMGFLRVLITFGMI